MSDSPARALLRSYRVPLWTVAAIIPTNTVVWFEWISRVGKNPGILGWIFTGLALLQLVCGVWGTITGLRARRARVTSATPAILGILGGLGAVLGWVAGVAMAAMAAAGAVR